MGILAQGESFVIAEWGDAGGSVDPPRYIAPLHLHRQDDEAWYVLEGVLGVRKGDETMELPAGRSVMVRGGTPHTYWNASTERLRYLIVMTKRIHELIEAIHAAEARDRETMSALFRRYDSELIV